MKEIKAIIQPARLDRVVDALCAIEGLPGVRVYQVTCLNTECRSHNADINMQLEVSVPDELVEPVLNAIESSARTGRHGDGSIFVVDIEKTVRIRSGESDDS